MPPTQHCRLGASKASRWMACAGSVRLAEGLPDIDTPWKAYGRMAHALAEHALRTGRWPDAPIVGEGLDWDLVTDEMKEEVQVYLSYISSRLAEGMTAGGAPRVLIERTYNLSLLNPPEDMYGTADVTLVGNRWIEIVDLKEGYITVEARQNPQLLYYLLGAVLNEFVRLMYDATSTVSWDPDTETILEAALKLFDEFRATIVQPRVAHTDGPVRSWHVTSEELQAFATELIFRANAAQNPQAPLTVGPHCRFCPAQGRCPAMHDYAQLTAESDFSLVPLDTPPAPELLTVEQVGVLLTKVEVLENWFSSLRRFVANELEQGRPVPGWKLVEKRAQRVWAENADQTAHDLMAMGLDGLDVYETKLKSPAQIEKIVGRNKLPETMVSRVSSGTTLVPETDHRPAVRVGPEEDFAAPPLAEQQLLGAGDKPTTGDNS